ncbi:glycoside hydrolase family 13 protein [Sporolactobacillus vineae]|uniref:glycoside hydrolase family 13 protein n=1 Tax=Sporolactobacillus vineae TaxID=444463 RepID=UPI0002888919|nr:glycoside hydrolase family 13 protein [Sporolactobacillus vineae]
MEKAAVLHLPGSEYAYCYDRDTLHLKIRTKKNDIRAISLIFGDPYAFVKDHLDHFHWQSTKIPMKMVAQTELHDYWFAAIKPPFHRAQYGFALTDQEGRNAFYGDRGFLTINEQTLSVPENYFKFPYMHEIDRFKAPEWVKKTIWYQIFPERFANGDPSLSPDHALPWGSKDPGVSDFFGGDLQGIIDHLDDLQQLGINGIYLNPIFTSPSNHKYDTLDYMSVDPHFGDKETFRKLVDEAHRRGIRIMLDAVFNHIGSASKQWQDVVRNEDQSPYKDWFHIHSFPVRTGENGNIEGRTTLSFDTFGFTLSMPKLNTANPEVQKYLLDIAVYWIKAFDIDGWRLDVANEVDHAFWKKFYQTVTSVKKDVYIVGEIWHSARNWLQGDEFHSVMNYPLTESIINFFLEDKTTATDTVSTINEHFQKYMQPVNEVAFNLLDSHDTARILTKAGGDKQKVKQALAFLFAQTGSPCLYYGTEIGLDGGNDPLCRKCMIWDKEKQDQEMLDFTKQLIRLRKAYQPLISYGRLEWLTADDEKRLLVFRKSFKGQTLIFIFNHGKNDRAIRLNGVSGKVTDIWNHRIVVSGSLTVAGGQFAVLGTDL